MITVYKYEIRIDGEQKVTLPEGAQILHVGDQDGRAYLWAKVDTEMPAGQRTLHIRGTGHPFNGKEGRHIGTFQQLCGQLVWHVFEDVNAVV